MSMAVALIIVAGAGTPLHATATLLTTTHCIGPSRREDPATRPDRLIPISQPRCPPRFATCTGRACMASPCWWPPVMRVARGSPQRRPLKREPPTPQPCVTPNAPGRGYVGAPSSTCVESASAEDFPMRRGKPRWLRWGSRMGRTARLPGSRSHIGPRWSRRRLKGSARSTSRQSWAFPPIGADSWRPRAFGASSPHLPRACRPSSHPADQWRARSVRLPTS